MKTALFLIALACAGCTTREITYGGVSYRHNSLGVKQTVGRIEATFPDGARVSVENYSNDQVTGLDAVVRAAIDQAVKSTVKP